MSEPDLETLLQDQYQEAQSERERRRGQELLATIDFGLQVKSFLAGPVGQRILADAEKETQKLMAEIANRDPDDPEERKMIRILRQRLGILSHWQDAFAEYIHAGEQAEVEYQEGEFPGD